MRRLIALLAPVASLASTASLACSCDYPETMTRAQLRRAMNELAVVGYGRVTAVAYPDACRVAPLRWISAVMNRRLPVVYSVHLRRIVWGRSPRLVNVVQYQRAGWTACEPLGSAACQPELPERDALWPLHRSDDGRYSYAGRCGIMLAIYALHLQQDVGGPK